MNDANKVAADFLAALPANRRESAAEYLLAEFKKVVAEWKPGMTK